MFLKRKNQPPAAPAVVQTLLVANRELAELVVSGQNAGEIIQKKIERIADAMRIVEESSKEIALAYAEMGQRFADFQKAIVEASNQTDNFVSRK